MNQIFERLNKLHRKHPMRIYRDEKTGQIVEELLLKDSAAAYSKPNDAKLIHEFIFSH